MCEWLCGFDGTIIGSLQALPAWQTDLGYPTGARLGLLNAMSSITGCLISPFNAYICDRWGRRWPIRCQSCPRPRPVLGANADWMWAVWQFMGSRCASGL
jgi:MFS family permease